MTAGHAGPDRQEALRLLRAGVSPSAVSALTQLERADALVRTVREFTRLTEAGVSSWAALVLAYPAALQRRARQRRATRQARSDTPNTPR